MAPTEKPQNPPLDNDNHGPIKPGQPRPWALGGDAPEPQKVEEAKPQTDAQAKKGNAATFTGTDPLGRAIGPAEDHTKIKKVRDPETGKVVTPDKETGELPSQKKAREEAEKDVPENVQTAGQIAAEQIAGD